MFRRKKEELTVDNTVDDICFKILEELEDPSKWAIHEIEYVHIDGVIVLKYGREHCYDDSYMVRRLISPDSLEIPKKWRGEFDRKTQLIKERKKNVKNEFILDRINGKYSSSMEIQKKVDEIEAEKWTIENINSEYYYQRNKRTFWFVDEEDAMAFKLRWV